MSDQYHNAPGTNLPRHVPEDNHAWAWTLSAIAVVVLLIVGVWAINSYDHTANLSSPATTGQAQPKNSPDPNPLPGEEPKPIPR